MNPTYSSPRSTATNYSNTHSTPFYHPQQKDPNPQNLANSSSKPVPSFMQQQMASKSYQLKHTPEVHKNGGNSSAYLRTSN